MLGLYDENVNDPAIGICCKIIHVHLTMMLYAKFQLHVNKVFDNACIFSIREDICMTGSLCVAFIYLFERVWLPCLSHIIHLKQANSFDNKAPF